MTYSIVARDPASGELGVAVQSHWFSVGSQVPWAWPGVGAVATQATTRVDYGPRGLALMRDGVSAADALATLARQDPGRAARQVAMVDAAGRAAALTGADCVACAGDVQGDGTSCQGNLLVSEGVWPAMLRAYQDAPTLPLCDRLLAALMAGQDAGGDLRGVQSAALLVVPGSGERWETVVSLRVEDSADPLGELSRLLSLARAYRATIDEDGTIGVESSARAAALAPDSTELAFWAAVRAGNDVSDFPARWQELRRRLG